MAVVPRALVGINEDCVGVLYLLKLERRGLLVAVVTVGVAAEGGLLIGAADLVLLGLAVEA